METVLKRGRGRPKKEAKTLKEMEVEVIFKWLNNEPMTFEEAACALWMHEGRKTPKPLTKSRIIAIELGAMQKLKQQFAKLGINCIDDVCETSHYRSCADSPDIDNGE